MRNLTRMLALAVGMSLMGSSAALADSTKDRYKEVKKDAKTIGKLTKKFEKGLAKGKADKYVADIKSWAQGELGDLRAMGYDTKPIEEPKRVHGQEGTTPEPEKPKNPWFHDLAMTLHDVNKNGPKKRLAAMKKAERMYSEWTGRLKSKL